MGVSPAWIPPYLAGQAGRDSNQFRWLDRKFRPQFPSHSVSLPLQRLSQPELELPAPSSLQVQLGSASSLTLATTACLTDLDRFCVGLGGIADASNLTLAGSPSRPRACPTRVHALVRLSIHSFILPCIHSPECLPFCLDLVGFTLYPTASLFFDAFLLSFVTDRYPLLARTSLLLNRHHHTQASRRRLHP